MKLSAVVIALALGTAAAFAPVNTRAAPRTTELQYSQNEEQAVPGRLKTSPPLGFDEPQTTRRAGQQVFGGTFTKTPAPRAIGDFGSAPLRRESSAPAGATSLLVQGGSLKTWSFRDPTVEAVQVVLSTEGRPLDADIELYHGPGNTPCKMRVYVENGQLRPFSAVVETPRGPSTVAIRNIGQMELPFAADVFANDVDTPSPNCIAASATIQGGALRTYPFDPQVDSVEVLLKTDGRPLNARIETLQGPNSNKQVVELYTEDGFDRPFFCILETPGAGNVVRIVNSAPMEFPMTAAVVPHSINNDYDPYSADGYGGAVNDVVIGGTGW